MPLIRQAGARNAFTFLHVMPIVGIERNFAAQKRSGERIVRDRQSMS